METVAVRVAAVHRMSMSRRSSGSMSVTSASTYDAARLRPRGVLAATRLEVLSRIFSSFWLLLHASRCRPHLSNLGR